MPLYDVEHVVGLTNNEQEKLAKAFTAIHCKRFHTPSFFVNVRFTDVSTQPVYRGGVLRSYNRLIIRTRTSEGRSTEAYGQHCRDLIDVWDEIVVGVDKSTNITKASQFQAKPDQSRLLRTVWIMGALTTAVEASFQRPAAGEEISWLREHKTEFEELARKGDEDMQSLMKELETREDFAPVFVVDP